MGTRPFLTAAILSAAIVGASPAVAQEASLVCTNSGVQYKVGEYACIAACHGQRRLARCDALAERVSWTYVSDACPSAMINRPWPSEWSEIPATAAMTPIPVMVNMSAPTPEIQVEIAGHRSFYR